VSHPYIDEGDVRSFDIKSPNSDYVWHRDKNTRQIEILEGDGWQFQRVGDLPWLLKPGMIFRIERNEYHRLIKGANNLKVKITSLDK
jgi:quercetin dioxygenase-like cupin family protein